MANGRVRRRQIGDGNKQKKTVKNVRGMQQEQGLDSVWRMGGCAATMQKAALEDLNAHMRSQMMSGNNGL